MFSSGDPYKLESVTGSKEGPVGVHSSPQSVAIFGSMEHVLQIGFAARVTVRKRPGARSKVARLSRKLKVLQKDCRSSSLRPWGFRVGAGIRFGFSGSLSGTQSLTPPGILF